jgi:hypothetical protein
MLPFGAASKSSLACEFRQYDLEDVPPYEALSYCWGDASEQRNVICNGQTYPITTSLYEALARLRQEHEPHLIWADALCINQANDLEKGFQVSFMGWIFSHATRVVVWLGRADPEHALKLSKLFDSMSSLSEGIENDEFPWYAEEMALTVCGSPLWDALENFFDSTLFRRIWCVQEIRLARDYIWCWQDQQYSRQFITTLVLWLWQKPTKQALSQYRIPTTHYAWSMNGPLISDRCQLLQALSTFRDWQATDDRDKVYGILGLTELGDERHVITVDYGKSVAEVYRDAAIAVMELTGDLSILAHVYHNADFDGYLDYDSWIPQWENNRWEPPYGIASELSLETRGYNGSATPAVHFRATRTPKNQLIVSGLVFDGVSHVAVVMDETTINSGGSEIRWVEPILDYWRVAVSLEPPQDQNVSPAMTTMARTLSIGQVNNNEVTHREATEEEILSYVRSFLSYIIMLYAISKSPSENAHIPYDSVQHGDG